MLHKRGALHWKISKGTWQLVFKAGKHGMRLSFFSSAKSNILGEGTKWWNHSPVTCYLPSLSHILKTWAEVTLSNLPRWQICWVSSRSWLKGNGMQAAGVCCLWNQLSTSGQKWRTRVCKSLASHHICWPRSYSQTIQKTVEGCWLTVCCLWNCTWIFKLYSHCIPRTSEGRIGFWVMGTGVPFLLSGNHVEVQIGYNEFDHDKYHSPGVLSIVNGSEGALMWPCPGSHQFVFSPKERK